LFPAIFIPLLLSFTYSLFVSLLALKGLCFLEFSCHTLVSSSLCKSPLSIICSAGLVTAKSFSVSLLWRF
jgi:hypothetical protein